MKASHLVLLWICSLGILAANSEASGTSFQSGTPKKCDQQLTATQARALSGTYWKGSFYRLGARQPINVRVVIVDSKLVMESWPDHLNQIVITHQGTLASTAAVVDTVQLKDKDDSTNVLTLKPYYCKRKKILIFKDAVKTDLDARQVVLGRDS